MYIGFKIIGVFGLILGPIIVVMLKTLQTIGLLPSFKPISSDDYEHPMKGQLKLDQLDKKDNK